MFLADNPLNQLVVDYLHKREPSHPLFAAPDSVRDPYMGQGSHPDVVEHVWKKIGSSLPMDCRCLVCGTPALVQPNSGILLAFCLGTQYCLRLPSGFLEEALKHGGVKPTTKWSNGTILDASVTFGPDWVFGAWKEDLEWSRKTYDVYNEPVSDSRI